MLESEALNPNSEIPFALIHSTKRFVLPTKKSDGVVSLERTDEEMSFEKLYRKMY